MMFCENQRQRAGYKEVAHVGLQGEFNGTHSRIAKGKRLT
jgi:hypothetical protein